MGCDIHIFVEAKDEAADSWCLVRPTQRYCELATWDPRWVESMLKRDEWEWPRYYEFFAKLSGVRGEPGPRGPIAYPGLPDDLTPEVAKEFADGAYFYHSFGYLTERLFGEYVLQRELQWRLLLDEARSVAPGATLRVIVGYDN